MPDLAYLHLGHWSGVYAYPVDVLHRGQKFARVKLRHRTTIGRTRYAAGTVRHRVPLDALSAKPARDAYVSQGGGRFR